MRLAIAVAAALAVVSLAAPSLACRVQPVTPVVARPPGGEVQRLLRAAAEADAAASREEIAARTADGRAAALERRADAALDRAIFLRGAERARVLSEAASLQAAAARTQEQADHAFSRAAELRQRARDLRDRAGAGTGTGWRPRPLPIRTISGGQVI